MTKRLEIELFGSADQGYFDGELGFKIKDIVRRHTAIGGR